MKHGILGIGLVAGLTATLAPVHAQNAPPTALATASATACPRGPVSIYFASGDVTASPQTRALLGKVGETIGSCQPDHVDLVARVRIDARGDIAEGDSAMAIALERLTLVADDLVAHGLPADRIRVSALAAEPGEAPPLNQVEIVFRKDGDTPLVDTPEAAPRPMPRLPVSII